MSTRSRAGRSPAAISLGEVLVERRTRGQPGQRVDERRAEQPGGQRLTLHPDPVRGQAQEAGDQRKRPHALEKLGDLARRRDRGGDQQDGGDEPGDGHRRASGGHAAPADGEAEVRGDADHRDEVDGRAERSVHRQARAARGPVDQVGGEPQDGGHGVPDARGEDQGADRGPAGERADRREGRAPPTPRARPSGRSGAPRSSPGRPPAPGGRWSGRPRRARPTRRASRSARRAAARRATPPGRGAAPRPAWPRARARPPRGRTGRQPTRRGQNRTQGLYRSEVGKP